MKSVGLCYAGGKKQEIQSNNDRNSVTCLLLVDCVQFLNEVWKNRNCDSEATLYRLVVNMYYCMLTRVVIWSAPHLAKSFSQQQRRCNPLFLDKVCLSLLLRDFYSTCRQISAFRQKAEYRIPCNYFIDCQSFL